MGYNPEEVYRKAVSGDGLSLKWLLSTDQDGRYRRYARSTFSTDRPKGLVQLTQGCVETRYPGLEPVWEQLLAGKPLHTYANCANLSASEFQMTVEAPGTDIEILKEVRNVSLGVDFAKSVPAR